MRNLTQLSFSGQEQANEFVDFITSDKTHANTIKIVEVKHDKFCKNEEEVSVWFRAADHMSHNPNAIFILGMSWADYKTKERELLNKPFDIGFGYKGNGTTVWNRAEQEAGDYKTIAHISEDHVVKFYEDLPYYVRKSIIAMARTKHNRKDCKTMSTGINTLVLY